MKKALLTLAVAALFAPLFAAPTAKAPPANPIPAATHVNDQTVPDHPYITGPAPEACLGPDTRVMAGAPVVLNAVLIPPPQVWVGKVPDIRFEVLEGEGSFSTFESLRMSPPGWLDRMLTALKWKWKPQKSFTIQCENRTGSAAVVFYPVGPPGTAVRLRAVST